MSANSVQDAHDYLVGLMPEGAAHVDCPLCHPGAGDAEKAEEVAEVADGERTFTEAQHFALLTDAVARETASLTTAKEDLEGKIASLEQEKASVTASLSELQSRVDVLEAEKAAAEQARDTAVAEFAAFKTELEEAAAIESRKADRVARVKAANSALGEDYFTDARSQRWAEMADEVFEALVADITEAAGAAPAAKTEDAATTAAVAETAAFKGGDAPTSGGGVSLFGQFMQKTGHAPAQV